jgi:hypothetical protein
MPLGMTEMVIKANTTFSGLSPLPPVGQGSLATPGKPLGDLCRDLEIATEPNQAEKVAYLNSWPKGIQEGLRAAANSAFTRNLPVTFVWFDGPYRLTTSEVTDAQGNAGGVSLVVQSPNPPDPGKLGSP